MAYNVIFPFEMIVAGDMSANITSDAEYILNQDNVGIQLNWTGSPMGSFDIQVSNDHKEDSQGNIMVAGNWISLTLNPTITATGSADVAFIDLNQLGAAYVRIVYTAGSGTGSLNAFLSAKGV